MTEPFGLIDHFECHLGTLRAGWTDPKTGIQVIAFPDQPWPGVDTYATLGLSHHLLDLDITRSGKQELLITVDRHRQKDEWIALLFNFAEFLLDRHRAVPFGEVLRFPGPLFESSTMSALGTYQPIYFEDSFAVFEGLEPAVQIVWAIPLYRAEADFVLRHGWDALGDIFLREHPDLWNIQRPMVTLP